MCRNALFPRVYSVQIISTCLVVLAARFVKTSCEERIHTMRVSMQAFALCVLVTY